MGVKMLYGAPHSKDSSPIEIYWKNIPVPDIGVYGLQLNIISRKGNIIDVESDDIGIVSKNLSGSKAIVFGLLPYMVPMVRLQITLEENEKISKVMERINLDTENRGLVLRYAVEKLVNYVDAYVLKLMVSNVTSLSISNIVISLSPEARGAVIFPKRLIGIPLLAPGEQITRNLIIGVPQYPLNIKVTVHYVDTTVRELSRIITIDKEMLEVVELAIFRREDLTPIYSHYMDVETNTLLGGMISAVQSMTSELFGGQAFIRVVDKGDIKIINQEGKHVIVALATKNIPPRVFDGLKRFVRRFEDAYSVVLEDFDHDISVFDRERIKELLEETLFADYRIIRRKPIENTI